MTEQNGEKSIGEILTALPTPVLSVEIKTPILDQQLKETPKMQKRDYPPNLQVKMELIQKSRIDAIRAAVELKKWPLYFFGDVGRGKSIMAAVIYAEWEQRTRKMEWQIEPEVIKAYEPQFWRCSELITKLIDAKFNHGEAKFKREYQDAGLVVLDDVADRGASDARRAALLDLMEWRKGMPLVVTGNFSPLPPRGQPSLSDILNEGRTVSRILEGQVFEFDGKDLRMQSLKITRV